MEQLNWVVTAADFDEDHHVTEVMLQPFPQDGTKPLRCSADDVLSRIQHGAVVRTVFGFNTGQPTDGPLLSAKRGDDDKQFLGFDSVGERYDDAVRKIDRIPQPS